MSEDRKLRYLFLDLNSYFASVEQQENPQYRGKPLAVCPVMADSSFVIAASYEAKRFGIKTGTMIGEAKRLCPDLICVHGNHAMYLQYHFRVQEAVEKVLPIEKVCSIDEMRFRLLGVEREPEEARRIALRMKKVLADEAGECMTCSIGIAPNAFLAKLGTELQKPNGLIVLESQGLPMSLSPLKLTDFTGINKRMQSRLFAAGIFNSEQLLTASAAELRKAFGSVVGERWWYLLRGHEMDFESEGGKSLGHSHVLAPELRTDEGVRQTLLRLLQKASARLRQQRLRAGSMVVHVQGFDASWKVNLPLPDTQDTVAMNEAFLREWPTRSYKRPKQVGITFHDLSDQTHYTPSLFEASEDREKLMSAIDNLNHKFGKNTVYLAGMRRAKDAAPERIAFGKTWLFKEGKGDNEWVDTFRGHGKSETVSDGMPQ